MNQLQKTWYYIILFNVVFSVSVCAQKDISSFVNAENLKHAGISFKLVDLTTKKTIAAYNENMALIPASTMKLVTTAASIDLLGENYVYRTKLLYDGILTEQGVLKGNIYVEGVGDPTLGSEYLEEDKERFLKEWLAAIQKAGIRTISGNVVILDQLFGYNGVSSQWTWEDLGNYYAAGTYGISVFDNTYKLYLKSGAKGTKPAILKTQPVISDLNIDNHLVAATTDNDDAYIYGIPFSYDRSVSGTIPQNRASFVVKGDIPDPGYFLADTFISYLKQNGIKVEGKPTTFRLSPLKPKSTHELAMTSSKPLTEIIRVVNVRSNNHYAEHLFHTIEANFKTTIADFWTNKGLDTGALFMKDGSGLSPANAVSASFLTDVLVYMNEKSKYSESFYFSLPIAGREGTVTSFLKNTSLEGSARIKSGSIRDVQSYAGYIDAGGKRYAFALIVNHYNGARSNLRKQMEQLLVGLF